jgi:two-component system KDP operon response regulator KdpE
MSAVASTNRSYQEHGVDLDLVATSHKRITAMIVDDEPETIRLMKTILINAGMDVVGAENGLEAIERCPHVQPDVILLDLMMPELDGYQTFTHLRTLTSAPIILITARSLKDDVVEGLQFGADDYLTKPFYSPELVARINTVVRRSKFIPPVSTYSFPMVSLTIDLEAREVILRDQKIYLPNKEFEILSLLAQQSPKMVTKEVIANQIWGEDNAKIQNRIKYFIHILRGKLELDPENPSLIISRGGMGYRLASEDENISRYLHSTGTVDL